MLYKDNIVLAQSMAINNCFLSKKNLSCYDWTNTVADQMRPLY